MFWSKRFILEENRLFFCLNVPILYVFLLYLYFYIKNCSKTLLAKKQQINWCIFYFLLELSMFLFINSYFNNIVRYMIINYQRVQ